jgi:predicted transcriptional regulator
MAYLIAAKDGKKAYTFSDTKMTILNLLLEGSKTVGEIADELKIQKVRLELICSTAKGI